MLRVLEDNAAWWGSVVGYCKSLAVEVWMAARCSTHHRLLRLCLAEMGTCHSHRVRNRCSNANRGMSPPGDIDTLLQENSDRWEIGLLPDEMDVPLIELKPSRYIQLDHLLAREHCRKSL